MLSLNKKKVKKILLTGGGTGGSVAPLLAIAENLIDCDFLWIGTKNGIEREMVEKEKINFKAIASGKLRRYFSIRNFIDPFLILAGFFQSLFVILKWNPDTVITAGSFVSVPVVWAAWLLGVPVLVHQQDVRPGLANKLMAPFAKVITVTFEKSLKDYGKKAIWTGNPIRRKFQLTEDEQKNIEPVKLKNDLPVVFVVGGGTGAVAINELVRECLDGLTKICQVIHVTGKNKAQASPRENYYHFEFFNSDQMFWAYSIVDIVVSRCGMGALTELSFLGRPAILIPMPDSHQEENAEVFRERDAAIVLEQKELTSEILLDTIEKVVNDGSLKKLLSSNISSVMKKGASEELAKIVLTVISG